MSALTLDTFDAEVSCPAALAWASTSFTGRSAGRDRMNVVRGETGRAMTEHGTGLLGGRGVVAR